MKNDNRIILNLKREWFEKIRSGEKRIEYRRVGPYWIGRFCRPIEGGHKIRRFNTVEFRCGYSKKDAIVFEIKNIDIGPCPYEGWDGDYFRIHLGAQLVYDRSGRLCCRVIDDFVDHAASGAGKDGEGK